jgi:hypothetical protein
MRHRQMESLSCFRGDDSHHHGRQNGVCDCREHHEQPERHPRSQNVNAAASKTRKVDAGTTAGEGKSALGLGINLWASPSARSAQIRGAVSVHQDSLIH